MTEIVKRNFDLGKQLLVAVLLLSINLVIQLFGVADNVDLKDGMPFTWMGASMTVSYVLTAVSMIIVLQEFFQIKTKMRGLLALNALLEKTPEAPEEKEPLENEPVQSVEDEAEESTDDPLEELLVDEEEEFDNLLDELDDDMDDSLDEEFEESGIVPSLPVDEDIMQRYKTTKIKIDDETGEMEPIIDDGGLQELIEQADLATDEEQQLAKIVADSEIIQTLNELEGIVKELKAKQSGHN